MSNKIIEKVKGVWSDFWLDDDDFEETNLPFDEDLVFEGKDSPLNTGVLDHATLKLASGRRAIANFVNILTGEDIPVYFWGGYKTGATDGKVVYLSADIVKKEDFDPAVGLALHEGSHIVLTDFDLIKTLWGRISELYKLGKEVGIDKEQVRSFTHLMVNYVEDRYIDNYIFTTAPGYRPYYVALYDKYFNNDIISKQLQSKLMRHPNLTSYEARIINLTNPATDLDALPGLREIAEQISLQNINRLKTTKDRIKVATEITKIVFKNIKRHIDQQNQNGMGNDKSDNNSQDNGDVRQEIQFDIKLDESDNDSDSEKNDKQGKPIDKKGGEENKDSKSFTKEDVRNKEKEEKEESKSTKEDVKKGDKKSENGKDENEDKVLGGKKQEAEKADEPTKKPSELKDDIGSDSSYTKKDLQTIKKIIDSQKTFIDNHGNVEKKSVSAKQKALLDVIEKSGIILVTVGEDLMPGNEKALGIECVVVKKLTKELMFSGMFPMCNTKKLSAPTLTNDEKFEPPENIKNAVIKGIQLGTLLGKKLQIRQESNVTIFPRRTSGKIFKRHLADIGCGVESVFYKSKVDKYDKLNLHISVDASSSMADNGKWERTMTMVVAICKAASMIDNLRVVVSFRTTIENKSTTTSSYTNSYLPYVVCAYDSSKDKFSKVKSLFPYLFANGATPEGLAFEATMDELICRKAGEVYYFLTLSDGQPAFTYHGANNVYISYDYTVGGEHTRKQYKKIQASGVKGIAYFIKGGTTSYVSADCEKCFRHMYGKDAKFIDVNNVTSIAKTMNDLFLEQD